MLNFLRSGDLPPQDRVRAVHKEAQYYTIGPLLEQLENMQPLKGEKVRQAFLELMPYYKGEGSTAEQLRKRVARPVNLHQNSGFKFISQHYTGGERFLLPFPSLPPIHTGSFRFWWTHLACNH